MADKEQFHRLTQQGVEAWNAWRRQAGQGAEIDLNRADLIGANLREANLYEVNLRGANLREANLFCPRSTGGGPFFGTAGKPKSRRVSVD